MVLPNGVFLFLGYSIKDEELLKTVTGEGVMETIGAIQGLVSYHNINGNKVYSITDISSDRFNITIVTNLFNFFLALLKFFDTGPS